MPGGSDDAKYVGSLDVLGDPVWVFDIESLELLAVNSAAVREFGYARHQFATLPVPAIASDSPAKSLKEHVARLRDGAGADETYELRRADGSTLVASITSDATEVEGRPAHVVRLQKRSEASERVAGRTSPSETMRRAEMLLEIAGEAGHIGGWLVDLETGELEWSPMTCAIHEVPSGHVPSVAEAINFYAPEFRPVIQRAFDACVRDGTPFDETLQIVTTSGRRVWVRAIGAAVRDASGRILRVQGAFQDLTRTMEAERALARSERRFHDLADAIPQIIWTSDNLGRVDFANRSYYAYTGRSPSDRLRQEWLQAVHPDDLPACFSAWEAAARVGAEYALEFRLRRADGDFRWHWVTGHPIRGEAGEIEKWYGTAIDIEDRKRIEQEAGKLARHLTTTLESLTDGFFTLDGGWRFTFLNRSAERLFRRGRDEMLGKVFWDEFPKAGALTEQEYRRAIRDGVSVVFEVYHSQFKTWLLINASPSDEGLAVSVRDITEQREAADRLRDSESRFRAVARATADVIWDWDLEQGTVWWNDAYQTLLGYSEEQSRAGVASWTDRIHPDDRARVLASIHAAIDERREHWTERYRFLHKDGSVLDVEDRGFLILDRKGEAIRFVGGMTDITARRRAERQIERQAALLEHAQDAILVRGLDHRIQFWNRSAERIYGWSAAEAVGRSVEDLLYSDPTAFRAATASVLSTGAWTGLIKQRTRSGQELTVEGHWTLMSGSSSEDTTILAINTDVTGRLTLEQQLQQSQRLESIGQLTGGIAHDFNNLLTVILGNAELLSEELAWDERLGRLAKMTGEAARRGAELTHRLLAFSRRQALAPKVVEVAALVEGMRSLLQRTLTEAIEMNFVLPADLWAAFADPAQLESALLNLTINARDAMPEGGQLTVEASNTWLDADYAARHPEVTPGAYVMIGVTDTGSGIAAADLDKVFEPFFTTKAPGKGTGLGLSMVYGFAKQSRGHVRIYTELGRGTAVKLYLPRVTARDEASAQADELDSREVGGRETILVVEDDELVRAHVEGLLASLGYAVVAAGSGPAALALLREDRKIDLLFTDVIMPGGMNGKQVADAAQQLRPGLKILYTSGYTQNAIMHQGRLDPGVHLLSKPYRRNELARMLRMVLDTP